MTQEEIDTKIRKDIESLPQGFVEKIFMNSPNLRKYLIENMERLSIEYNMSYANIFIFSALISIEYNRLEREIKAQQNLN